MDDARNLALGLSYTVSEPEDPRYPDQGWKLTNGRYADLSYTDPEWVGFTRGMTRSVIIDLGGGKTLASIKANFFSGPELGISVPLTVSYYVSEDGRRWSTVAHVSSRFYIWEDKGPRTQEYVWDGSRDGLPAGAPEGTYVYARYVRVDFSVFQHIFIDEIEVWGCDGRKEQAVVLPPDDPKFLPPGEASGGIRHLALLPHHGQQNEGWTQDKLIPYISYVNPEGEPTDWMFDGIAFAARTSPEQRCLNEGLPPGNQADWLWYLERIFRPGGDAEQLQEAVRTVAQALDEPGKQVHLVLSLPYPSPHQHQFGEVEEDGQLLSFSQDTAGAEEANRNRRKAVAWYIGELMRRWEKGSYENLKLTGLYWTAESLSDVAEDMELIRFTRDLAHAHGLKLFWVPHFQAIGAPRWKEAGFDAAALQPNHLHALNGECRIRDAAQLAKQYGMGFALEIDGSMNVSLEMRRKYTDYLNGGLTCGYAGEASFKAYYQITEALYDSAVSQDPEDRVNYDWMYQFLKGMYRPQDGGLTLDGSRNLVLHRDYHWSEPPSQAYPDTGNKLTDGDYGTANLFHRSWQGHVGGSPTREVTFDLGGMKTITRIKSGFLQDTGMAIYFPAQVIYSLSSDGVHWHELARVPSRLPLGEHGPASMQVYGWHGFQDGIPGSPEAGMAAARYVKVTFPVELFVFISEVEVFGFDEIKEGAVELPAQCRPRMYLHAQ